MSRAIEEMPTIWPRAFLTGETVKETSIGWRSLRRRKDRHPIEVSLTVSPVKNARGQIVGISSIARDITQRNRAQAVLEQQAAVLREQTQMLDLANVLARDLDDRIILWNTGMEKMYG